ncbi:ABC transporter substrate-binding protein [Actinomycetospora straminea]|uniref:ABC transporter substrate-binding protein n=1 Tax=Actinomycetospora straminea TaxID=663607 RepID=A0ABP9DXT1_9PSEU|nr:ABC transporter substrate-binding protein [Actinomycetospora straminea]MDD7932521.1 ABC transporter substrate-binding protein [Actinomycetospora straminea]
MDESAPLRVGSALPDPPFELDGTVDTAGTDGAVGFDPAVMQEVARRLGREYVLVRYEADDFDGIFAGLERDEYDVVASGATITPHRRTLARFCRPHVRSGQSLVVDRRHHPDAHGVDDLAGGTVGVQRGNTSEPVAEELARTGRIAAVRHYAYHDILTALDDVAAGRIDGFMKLEPVMRWLTRDRPDLAVVQTGITQEEIGVAVRRDDGALADRIDGVLDELRGDGTLARLGRQWLGTDAPGTTTAVLS